MIDYQDELLRMREGYSPPESRELRKPDWLGTRDKLCELFDNAELLYTTGQIYYAAIVQANTGLFKRFGTKPLPAALIYSTDPFFAESPDSLISIADIIYDCKDKHFADIPPALRDVAGLVKDEYTRLGCEFRINSGGESVNIIYTPTIIFRNHLPGGRLTGRLLPILARPRYTRSVLPLPREYWTDPIKDLFRGKK